MAQISLTVQTAYLSTGSALTASAVHGPSGNSFGNDGRALLHIINTGAGAVTAFAHPNTSYVGVVFPVQTLVVPSSITGMIWGPFHNRVFNQSDGTVLLGWTGYTATTTVSVINLPLTGI